MSHVIRAVESVRAQVPHTVSQHPPSHSRPKTTTVGGLPSLSTVARPQRSAAIVALLGRAAKVLRAAAPMGSDPPR
eukprot:scaffold3_cov389-Prasinococcus_capsulatus_cf.AAC.5